MKNRVLCLAFSSVLGLGAAFAAQAPADQQQAQQQQQQAAPQDQSAAPAPQNGRPAADPNKQIKMLTKRLNLTADQQNQILPILTDRQQQVAGIVNDNTLSRKDRHQKLAAVREDSKSKIEAVLNNDQKQAYEQMVARQHQHRKQNAQS